MLISTVVFLHGWGGNRHSFDCVSRTLKKEEFISLDFPGFGEEAPPTDVFGVADYAKWLYLKLKELDSDKFVLVGHSFGGRVALQFSYMYPNLVEKLVLVDSAGIKPRYKINKTIKIIWFRFCKKCAKMGIYSKERLSRHGSADYKALPESMRATFVKVVNEDLSHIAKLIRCKTLIVWGDKDTETPLYMAKKLNKLITNSKLVVFAGAGHFAYVERAEEFSQLLINFL